VAYKGGQAAGMEMPNRLVSARNAIHLLPRPLLSTVQEVDETPLTEARIIQLQSEGLCQVHTQGFIDNLRAELESGDARAVASFTAFSSLLTITDQVLAACPLRVGAACPGCAAGLALVRPAGHHSLPDEAGCLCALNSVLAVAAREADKGKTVGVLDVDVHYARGSQQIAMERNRRRGVGQGRVLVADVYAAAGPPATYVQEVQNHHRRCKETLDAAALRTEMDEEFAGKQHRQAEMNDPVKAMVCESFLFFPFDPQVAPRSHRDCTEISPRLHRDCTDPALPVRSAGAHGRSPPREHDAIDSALQGAGRRSPPRVARPRRGQRGQGGRPNHPRRLQEDGGGAETQWPASRLCARGRVRCRRARRSSRALS